MTTNKDSSRRHFIKKSSLVALGLSSISLNGMNASGASLPPDHLYLIGPRDGYSPQIGTLLSTMTMMRKWLVETVQGLSIEQLDFQLDDKSNSIGAMLLHLAATERYYQLNTFDGMEWGSWSEEIKEEWDIPMGLGDKARAAIKGHEIGYYIDRLNQVREVTETEFAKRDDEWIMKSEPFFEDKPTNNYCKWFHVCEHESNHRGQIKFLLNRIPKS